MDILGIKDCGLIVDSLSENTGGIVINTNKSLLRSRIPEAPYYHKMRRVTARKRHTNNKEYNNKDIYILNIL